MRFPRTIVNAGISLYLLLTACAFSFTLFRWSPLPFPLVKFFYGMMAPYQDYSDRNADLVAEGQKADGTWEHIDLLPYFPVSTGERTYRMYMQTARNRGSDIAEASYERFRELLHERENARGRVYSDVRLAFEIWPASPAGFEALRLPTFTERFDPMAL
jgi:hypothetical protein